MMIDLGQRAANYAIYTPSAQVGAAEALLVKKNELRGGVLPGGLAPRSLDYLWPENGHWFYPHALATAGHFKNATRPNAITNRAPKTVIIGDSSGFQLGTGAMPETKSWMKFAHKPKEIMHLFRQSKIKQDVHSWLEMHCDIGLSLDLVLWAHGLPKSPFQNLCTEQLIRLSVENLELFQQESGHFRKVKYLSVLQGGTVDEEEQWFTAVKPYAFHGYALAGNVGQMGGIYRVLRRLLRLRDLKLLSKPYSNVHILRLSRPRWAPILTAIQNAVRATENDEFTVTYDSSSPYKISGMTTQFASLTNFGKSFDNGWTIQHHKAPVGYGFANMADPFRLDVPHPQYMPMGMDSPIASLLTAQDINFRKGKRDIRTIDRLGDGVITNHNCYVYVMAMILANEAVFGETPTAPESMMEPVKVIGELFRTKNWQAMLDDNRALLASVVGDKR